MRKAALAVLLCACFDPGPAPLLCSEAQPGCPDGLVCLGGMCMDSTSGAGDMQVMDMMITDLSSLPGCADGKGSSIGNNGCWTCPGIFSASKKASTLCRSGFSIPTNSNLIADSDCLAVVSGFFYASVFGATNFMYSDPNQAVCSNMPLTLIPAFFGCGPGGGVVSPGVACRGFRPNLQCSSSNGLTCQDSDLDKAANSKATNGVLCCPK